MAKQEILFGFHNMTFKKFELDVANKKALSTQSLSYTNWNFLLKRHTFLRLQNFVSQVATPSICLFFTVSKNQCIENYMKLVLTTNQLEFFKISYNLPCEQNKGYGRNMGTWSYIIYLFMLLFMHLFIDVLVWKKEKIPYNNLYLKLYKHWFLSYLAFWC